MTKACSSIPQVHSGSGLTQDCWAGSFAANDLGQMYSRVTSSSNHAQELSSCRSKNAAGTYVKTSIKDYKYDKNRNVTQIAGTTGVSAATCHNFSLPHDVRVSPTRVTMNTYFNATPDATLHRFAGSNTNIYWSSSSSRENAIATTEIRKVTGGIKPSLSRAKYTCDNPSAPANRSANAHVGLYKGARVPIRLRLAIHLLATTEYNQYGMPADD